MEFPISNHPKFTEKYDEYAETLDEVSELFRLSGLNPKQLHKLMKSTRELEMLSNQVAFDKGVDYGFKCAVGLMGKPDPKKS